MLKATICPYRTTDCQASMERVGVPQRFLVDGNLQDGSKPSGGRLTDLDAIVQYQMRGHGSAANPPGGAHSHRLPPYVSA